MPWRLLVFAAAVFVAQGITESVVAPLFGLVSRVVGEPVPGYPYSMLAAVWLAVLVSLRLVDDAEWRAVGLGPEAWRWRPVAGGWLLGTLVIGLTAALLFLLGYLRFVPAGAVSDALAATGGTIVDGGTDSWSRAALRLLVLLAPAALWEELIFRGYLWRVAEDAGGSRVALWSTSITFGLVHLMNAGAGVRTTVLVTLAGVCLGVLRARTDSLPAAWAAHLAWNWTMGAVLHVPVSGMPFSAPGYRAVVMGPSWLTGGTWGPEGGLIAAAVLGGALVIGQRPSWTHTRIKA